MSKKLIYLVSFVLVLGLVLTSAANATLIGWWKFDEGAGTTAADSSGNGYDGTLGGISTWVAGQHGGALAFDGAGWVDVTVEAWNDNIFDGFSVCFWAYTDSATQQSVPMTMRAGSNNPRNFSCHTPWNQTIYFDVRPDGGGNYQRVSLGDTSAQWLSLWSHWTFVYTPGQQQIYLNGELFVEGTGTGAIQQDTTGFTIGADNAHGAGFIGTMDDIRLYDHVISEAEMLAAMEGGGKGYPYALGPNPSDGTYHPDTWVNLAWRAGDFAASHDVYIGDNFEDVDAGAESTFQGNQTDTFLVAGFPGFPFSEGLVPGTTYYWRIDEVNEAEPNSPWTGKIWSFTVPPKTAYLPEPADGTELVDLDVRLSWTAGFGSKLHYVYFGDNFDDVNTAAGGLPQGAATYTPGTLEMAKTYYWRVDEFDVIGTYKGNVWSFTTEGAAESLDPVNGTVDVKQTQILKWSPSVFAASHQIYFGTNKDAVHNADTGSPEYKGTSDLGSETLDPGKLEWDTIYYWRIDEVNNTNPNSPWMGLVWSFTTANFLIVDDFESYNDIDPPDPQSNRIFEAWSDGYEIPTNGALVGNELPPYAEQSIVHSGIQSMPYFYDNSVGYSEATLTLTYPRDWTEKGVDTLTIWFRGSSVNAAETLYVALNGSAVVSNDNPDAAQIATWTEWSIPLQAFADQGVNLANVNTIALGLGNRNNPQAGGSGTMYFDDIRLYPPAP